MEILDQYHWASKRVDVEPFKCVSMLGTFYYYYYLLIFSILVHVPRDLGKMNIL